MKLKILFPALATMAIAACTKAPETSEAGQEVEERLQRMEAQLARIEAAIVASPPAAATGLQTKEQLKFYVSGAVVQPGQYQVETGISLLAALAVAGGPSEYADQSKIKISRIGQEDQVIADKNAFKDVILAEGDVVVVPQSFW